jgi:hypothetical protein
MNEDIKNKILEVLEGNHKTSLWSADNRLMVAKQIAVSLGEENDTRTRKVDKVSDPKGVPDVKSESIDNPVDEGNPFDGMVGGKIEILNTRITDVNIKVEPDIDDLPDVNVKEEEQNKEINKKDTKKAGKQAKPKKNVTGSSHKIDKLDKNRFFNKPKEKRTSGLFSKKTKRK